MSDCTRAPYAITVTLVPCPFCNLTASTLLPSGIEPKLERVAVVASAALGSNSAQARLSSRWRWGFFTDRLLAVEWNGIVRAPPADRLRGSTPSDADIAQTHTGHQLALDVLQGHALGLRQQPPDQADEQEIEHRIEGECRPGTQRRQQRQEGGADDEVAHPVGHRR